MKQWEKASRFEAILSPNSFCSQAHVTHIQVPIDNTTAVSYINNMGVSKSLLLNKLELKSGDGVLIKTSGPRQCTLQGN